MIHLVTFSDESMSRARDLCVDSATNHGVDGITWAYAASEADKQAGRGLGFWAWKPRIIFDFLTDTTGGLAHPDDGDYLIYADAGVEFINNVSHVIDRMDQDVWLFGNNWEHAHWCKRDIVESVWPDTPWEAFGKQVQASVIFFRVSDFTRKFVRQWLNYCLHPYYKDVATGKYSYLIDDTPSHHPNHPEFQENRHDQAILTTMAYREGIKLHWWPAVYNDGQFTYEKLPVYAGDDYPAIFHHHRRRNHEWSSAA